MVRRGEAWCGTGEIPSEGKVLRAKLPETTEDYRNKAGAATNAKTETVSDLRKAEKGGWFE